MKELIITLLFITILAKTGMTQLTSKDQNSKVYRTEISGPELVIIRKAPVENRVVFEGPNLQIIKRKTSEHVDEDRNDKEHPSFLGPEKSILYKQRKNPDTNKK